MSETHILEGRKVDCKRSLDRVLNRQEQKKLSGCKIFVHKLKKQVDDQKLEEYFSQFAKVKNAYVV